MSDARNVWVFIEVVRGKIKGVSLELLGQGRKMADDLGEKLVAIIPEMRSKILQKWLSTMVQTKPL